MVLLSLNLNKRSNHDRIEKEINESLATAVKWGIPCLIVFSGNRNGIDDKEGQDNTIDGLKRVAKAAEDAGVTLVLELLNSKVDHHDYQCDRTDWGVEVCKAVDSSRVKLLYDIYHMQIMEGDVCATVTENIEYIAHFHTGGVPGRRDIDETQELNYTRVCQAIASTKYKGYLAHEFGPKNKLDSLAKAIRICDV